MGPGHWPPNRLGEWRRRRRFCGRGPWAMGHDVWPMGMSYVLWCVLCQLLWFFRWFHWFLHWLHWLSHWFHWFLHWLHWFLVLALVALVLCPVALSYALRSCPMGLSHVPWPCPLPQPCPMSHGPVLCPMARVLWPNGPVPKFNMATKWQVAIW